MKLILADDHTLFRNGLALLLKAHCPDCEIWEGDGLDAALAEAEAHPDAEVALLDLNMPGMDGVHGIRRFAELQPRLPLIILSGADSQQQIQDVLAAGASFIPKSSTPAVMVSAIKLVLSGGTYVPPQALSSALTTPQGRSGLNVREHTQLTERQMQVLRLLAAGKPNKVICRELDIEEGTVKAHIATIFRVLDVTNRTEAASVARNLGLLD